MKFLLLLAASVAAFGQSVATVAQWTRFETSFTSSKDYENAVLEVQMTVAFTAPSGAVHNVDAFWDGEQIWKVRFSPDEVGRWSWRTTANDPALNGQSGVLNTTRYGGPNQLYRHGAITRSKDGYSLQHADGTPFFWLADTAWAGAMLSSDTDWTRFIQDRLAKRFTAIQFMGTQNIAAAGDAQGRQAFGGREKIVIDPYFFRRLDKKFDALNEAGMIASPTFLWAAEWHPSGKVLDPGAYLPDDQAILLGRYITARYGAHQVVWMFAGDHDYRGSKAERWRKLGRAIFGDKPQRLVTVHPAPRMLLKREFGEEPWLGFLGYQSSHSGADSTVKWIVQGEPATDWNQGTAKPVINIEPIYEAHMNFGAKRKASPLDIRRAVWWSLLVSPTAGVTYGAHGIWSWETQPAVPMNHYRTGVAPVWHEALALPGSTHMRVMRTILDRLPWNQLRPAQNILADQPGASDVQKFIVAALTGDGQFTLIYTPVAGTIRLTAAGGNASWLDPTTGVIQPAKGSGGFTTPGPNGAGDPDWVLLIKR